MLDTYFEWLCDCLALPAAASYNANRHCALWKDLGESRISVPTRKDPSYNDVRPVHTLPHTLAIPSEKPAET